MSNINIKICEVISVEDEYNSGRIKVALFPDDAGKEIEDIPYAYPLLPKTFYVIPKIGEAVLIFLTASGDGSSNRYYVGPIVSQLPNLEYSNISTTALNNYPGETTQINVNYDLIRNTHGAFGNNIDVCVYGRKGSDIILKENDIRVRAGARIDSDNKIGTEFNKLNPSYLKLKYSETPCYYNAYGEDGGSLPISYNSSATIVADEISLLSHKSTRNFNLTDNEELINENEMKKIMETAHVLPYGDVLVEFLEYFLKMFQQHSHKYPGLPTILPSGHQSFFDYDLKKILSKNVRIN